MSREVHVRFWESAKARFPRATQLDRMIFLGILRVQRLAFYAHPYKNSNGVLYGPVTSVRWFMRINLINIKYTYPMPQCNVSDKSREKRC